MEKDLYYMKLAFNEALKAKELDEVPIGAIVVFNDEIIGCSYNRKTLDKVATYHAEILAIEEACKKLGSWYLDECVLYTTVEPCMMCTGAIIQSRLSKVVYGAKNEAFGYLSKLDNVKFEVIFGVMAEECKQILTDFFREKRSEKN